MNRPNYALNTAEFFADFFLVPIFIMFMMHYNNESLPVMIVMLSFGMLSWTLYEYLMHRFLFHCHPWFITQHDDHHAKPKALVGNKPWMTAVATAAVWGVIYVMVGVDIASAYTSGLLLGYLIYSGIHVNLHHGDPKTFSKPLAKLYAHHAGHHRGGKTNFGVSVDWWDRLFRTKG